MNDIERYYYYRYHDIERRKNFIDNTMALGALGGFTTSGIIGSTTILSNIGLSRLAGTGLGAFTSFGVATVAGAVALPVITGIAILTAPLALKASKVLAKTTFKATTIALKSVFNQTKK